MSDHVIRDRDAALIERFKSHTRRAECLQGIIDAAFAEKARHDRMLLEIEDEWIQDHDCSCALLEVECNCDDV